MIKSKEQIWESLEILEYKSDSVKELDDQKENKLWNLVFFPKWSNCTYDQFILAKKHIQPTYVYCTYMSYKLMEEQV